VGRDALDADARDVVLHDVTVDGERRRRRMFEGASTTSHADIRWLPRSGAAEHT
jgi:hypothetical protein